MNGEAADDPVTKLLTPESCEQFARNVEGRSPELAARARRRAVELLARDEGADSEAEVAAYEAVHAYERVLNTGRSRRVRASRTWRMIAEHGIIEAVERIVTRPGESQGYRAPVGMGLQDMAFEAVVLRFPQRFSPEAVASSRERLRAWSVESK